MNIKKLLFFLILFAIIMIIFWKSLSYPLIWDSNVLIKKNNLLIRDFPIQAAFIHGYWQPTGQNIKQDYYRPIVTASLMIDRDLWGLRSTWLRLSNLIIYCLSLFFLYIFFKAQTSAPYFAEIATALFAFFPLNTDNLIWIVGRSDLLMLLWGLICLVSLEKYIQEKRVIFLWISGFAFVAGMFSKEAFLFFFPVILLYEFIKRKKITPGYHIFNFLAAVTFFFIKSQLVEKMKLGFNFSSSLFENIQIGLAILGYYLKSLVFPFSYEMFLPVDNVIRFENIILGILLIFSFSLLIIKSVRKTELRLPIVILVVFIFLYLLFGFSAVFPFSISTRYMMIPLIGLIWIFTIFLFTLKKHLRIIIATIIVLTFIPVQLHHAKIYKSELHFWKEHFQNAPDNSFIITTYARELLNTGHYFQAESLLHRALKFKLKIETAVSISLNLAKIESIKANYSEARAWLARIKNLSIPPDKKYQSNLVSISIFRNQGNWQKAAALLESSIRELNRKELNYQLYNLYIGYNKWPLAREIELKLRKIYPKLNITTEQLQNKFPALSNEQKIDFYIKYGNFLKAGEILNNLHLSDFDNKLKLSKLYYFSGESEKARNIIEDLRQKNIADFRILNKIGYFYLKELKRAAPACDFFGLSLKLNNNQPSINILFNNLKKHLENNPIPRKK